MTRIFCFLNICFVKFLICEYWAKNVTVLTVWVSMLFKVFTISLDFENRFMVKPQKSDIWMTCKYIRVTYWWHTSTYKWHTDDIQVHTSDIQVTYGWHTSDIRMTYKYTQMTCEYIWATYEWHMSAIQMTWSSRAQ